MKTFIASVVATFLALAVGIVAGRQVDGLQRKAAELPTQPVVIPQTPPAHQRVMTDFDDPNTLFQPVTPDSPKGPLEPTDPVRKAAAESAATYKTVSQWAYTVAFIIPVVWVFAMYRKLKRAVMQRIEEVRHESECGEPNELQSEACERNSIPDGQGDAGAAPEPPPA
jgi:hypothetical protein